MSPFSSELNVPQIQPRNHFSIQPRTIILHDGLFWTKIRRKIHDWPISALWALIWYEIQAIAGNLCLDRLLISTSMSKVWFDSSFQPDGFCPRWLHVYLETHITKMYFCIFQWQDLPKKEEEMTKRCSVVCSMVRYYCVWGCLELQKNSEYDFRFLEMSSQIYFLSNCFMGTLGGLIKRDKEATKVPSWAMIA